MRARLPQGARSAGGAAVVPVALVLGTGLLLFFRYDADPVGGPRRLAELDPFFSFVRSLHLWSSRALVAALVAHTALSWLHRRVGGPYRTAYAWGAAALGAVGMLHMTGHVLRADGAGMNLAAAEVRALAFVGGAERWMALPGRDDAALLAAHVPVHVAVLPLALLVLTTIHLARARRAAQSPAAGAGAWVWRAHARTGLGVGAAIAAAAVLQPAPLAQEGLPWPFPVFHLAVAVTGRLGAFAAAAVLAWLWVGAQPWLARWPWAARASHYGLAGLFVLSLALEAV